MATKILVADDDKAIQRIVQRLLETEGFEVVVAVDGREALDQVTAAAPNLVILDVMMPQMNGLDVLEQIRSRYTADQLPVVMLTGQGEPLDVERGKQLGANLYLTKPFDPEHLMMAVAHVIVEHQKKTLTPDDSC